jgi:PBSX family phage portal protein
MEEVRAAWDRAVEAQPSPDPFMKSWDSIRAFSGIEKNFKRRTDRAIEKAFSGVSDSTARSKQIQPETSYQTGYGAFDVVTPPYDLYSLASYYETSFANHAAVDTKTANVISLGYHWELSDKAKSNMDAKESETQRVAARKKIERAKAQMSEWMDSLNDMDTFVATLEKVFTDAEATGQGYLEIGRKSNGEIGYVGHIPSMTMRVRRQHDGYVQIIGNSVVFFSNYGQRDYNPVTSDPHPNEVIQFKKYSPLNTYYGVPDVVSANASLLGDQFASQYNVDYFQNKAVPRYIVTTKGAKLSGESEEKLFAFLQGMRGQNHRTLYIPLPPDNDQTKVEFNMQAVENGIQEASFTKYHEQCRNDVLTAHQVPLSKIGMGDGSLAGTIASDRTFKEQVARPAQRQFEKVINKIISEVTDVLVFKFNELTLTDESAQSQIHEKYIRSQIVTPNEVRDQLGMPPRPGGEEIVDLTARQAADAKNEANASDSRATDRANNNSDSPTTISGRNPQGEGNSRQN